MLLSNCTYYSLFRFDRITNTHGGGILININKSYYELSISLVHNFELINTIELCDFISNVLVSSNSCLIYGDFNLPVIDWLAGTGHTRIEKYFYSFTQKEAIAYTIYSTAS